jgi:exopolysaccharide biosynthesis polyprenyl glycosylphosphotransferase
MIREQRRAFGALLWVGDVLAIVAAFAVAYWLRGVVLTHAVRPIYPLTVQGPGFLVALVAWVAAFYVSGLYRTPSPRLTLGETAAVGRATVLAAFGLALCVFAFKLVLISRLLFAIFTLLTIPSVIGTRAVIRRFVLNGSTRRYVVIVGGYERARQAASLVARHREWGLTVSGVISDGTWSGDRAGFDVPALGTVRDLGEILRRNVIDEVLIVPSPNDLDRVNAILARCEEEGILTRVLLNFILTSASHVTLEELGGVPLLSFSTAPKDEVLLLLRRIFDVALASVLLVLLSPLLLSIAVAILVSTPGGPVIFRQRRAGLHGRQFWMLKFRSMQIGADEIKATLADYNEMDGPAFKMSNDPRVTRFGRFLRKTSLDELPQLWNILRGDMSFVGPRPVPVEEVEQYEPWQRRRLSMKPGLTCLWQVSGRNELTFDEWMRLDLEYIDNWSLWLDLKIAIKTIPAVLLGRGAK